ncbi:PadR family transcriptional regulator [Kurthia sp. 3B1D]|uniref:PadR family transcriptional regulator n=1 Tax=Candidatus Kurthia intestinigallinarum TaxID=1562256 RepID=A0A433RXS9_9BACL|nr:PadR family transcriptional regulator [Kurthia sp. 3B1D]RUS58081.1 PadR family transcriptional regulator [Kurthia sp. 3B1D]
MKKHPLLPLSETMHYILIALQEPLHGYAIMQKIDELSEGAVHLAAGTLYGALDNMAKYDWIEQVGLEGRRKIYHITPEGQRILAVEKARLVHLLSLY